MRVVGTAIVDENFGPPEAESKEGFGNGNLRNLRHAHMLSPNAFEARFSVENPDDVAGSNSALRYMIAGPEAVCLGMNFMACASKGKFEDRLGRHPVVADMHKNTQADGRACFDCCVRFFCFILRLSGASINPMPLEVLLEYCSEMVKGLVRSEPSKYCPEDVHEKMPPFFFKRMSIALRRYLQFRGQEPQDAKWKSSTSYVRHLTHDHTHHFSHEMAALSLGSKMPKVNDVDKAILENEGVHILKGDKLKVFTVVCFFHPFLFFRKKDDVSRRVSWMPT